jgi:acyl-CoA dehydrogenase
MDVLNVPRPDWMSEDLVLLEEQARRFLTAEFAPHVERWSEERGCPGRC